MQHPIVSFAIEASFRLVGVLTLSVGFAHAFADAVDAQQAAKQKQERSRPEVPKPDLADVHYGEHARQVLDLWQAKSDRPTPLVVYIHGGGFRAGSKDSVSPALIEQCRRAGVSVAAINYRLTTEVPFPAAHHDSARAVQFLRHNAKRWNLDPKRFAATGGSAGRYEAGVIRVSEGQHANNSQHQSDRSRSSVIPPLSRRWIRGPDRCESDDVRRGK